MGMAIAPYPVSARYGLLGQLRWRDKEEAVITNCVNPSCREKFKRIGSGEIYTLERRGTVRGGWTEFFWLCPLCLPTFIISMTTTDEVELLPRSKHSHLPPPNPWADLRVIFAAKTSGSTQTALGCVGK